MQFLRGKQKPTEFIPKEEKEKAVLAQYNFINLVPFPQNNNRSEAILHQQNEKIISSKSNLQKPHLAIKNFELS